MLWAVSWVMCDMAMAELYTKFTSVKSLQNFRRAEWDLVGQAAGRVRITVPVTV